MTLEIDECERQAIVLALAKLSLSRPGWLHMLTAMAMKLGAEGMFGEFRSHGPDRIPGVCQACGCTEDDCSQCMEATAGRGCSWANHEQTLCTACVGALLRLGL